MYHCNVDTDTRRKLYKIYLLCKYGKLPERMVRFKLFRVMGNNTFPSKVYEDVFYRDEFCNWGEGYKLCGQFTERKEKCRWMTVDEAVAFVDEYRRANK
jgi:hypothetical protein